MSHPTLETNYTDPGTDLEREIAELGPWFHNLHLPGGLQTAPDHRLGDFPAFKWNQIAPHLPQNLTGWTALDIGCNAGFYSFELVRRGARVTAIDVDRRYLRQARWASARLGFADRIDFRQMQIYELPKLGRTYDLVLLMGVLYHLRYPVLGLDIVSNLVNLALVVQSLTTPGVEVVQAPPNLGMDERDRMREPGWPAMSFIEHELEGDPTNWWAPNHACMEALLRTCGMRVTARPGDEIYLCQPAQPSTERKTGFRAEYECIAGALQSADCTSRNGS